MTPPSPAGLPPERLRLPFGPGEYRMAMALTPNTPDDLLEIDDQYPAELAERRHLLETRHDAVFATTPGAAPAHAEILEAITDLLPTRYPQWFERAGDHLHNHLTNESWNLRHPTIDPLELAGRLVQEDLCIIDTNGPAPILAAALLCAPSRWVLAEKLGRPLALVHEHVPLYADRLSAAVDRFMRALRPGKSAERLNWSVVDDGALFQTGGKHRTGHNPDITPENAPDRLFLRVERQTFLRLPRSRTILFAIHVHSTPLHRILPIPGAAQDLAAAVTALPEPLAIYKSLPPIRQALLDCLTRIPVTQPDRFPPSWPGLTRPPTRRNPNAEPA